MSAAPARRLWPYALLLVLGLGGLLFGLAGVAMAASLAGSTPESLAHWRRVAIAYEVLMALSVVTMLLSSIMLWRRSMRTSRDAQAAS